MTVLPSAVTDTCTVVALASDSIVGTVHRTVCASTHSASTSNATSEPATATPMLKTHASTSSWRNDPSADRAILTSTEVLPLRGPDSGTTLASPPDGRYTKRIAVLVHLAPFTVTTRSTDCGCEPSVFVGSW